MSSDFVSTRDISLFADDALCLETLNKVRIESGRPCPRCQSGEVIFRPQTRRLVPAFLCQNCNYRFAATAGTIFMGSMMPLSKCFQMLTLYNALGDSLPIRDARYVIGVTKASVNRMTRLLKTVNPVVRFTTVESSDPTRIRLRHDAGTVEGVERFYIYCERRAILVSEDGLIDALRAVISTPRPGLIEAYKRRSDARVKVPRAPPPEVLDKKGLANRWAAQLREAMPGTTAALINRMAWHLAALDIRSDEMLAALGDAALKPAGGKLATVLDMRDRYLAGRGVPEIKNRAPME